MYLNDVFEQVSSTIELYCKSVMSKNIQNQNRPLDFREEDPCLVASKCSRNLQNFPEE